MPKGVPRNGRRQPPRRWNHETLAPLHTRLRQGETLREIAFGLKTSSGRLRQAFIYFGFDLDGLIKFRKTYSPPPVDRRFAEEGRRYRYLPCEPVPRPFDAESHREARHYKGNFSL